LYNLEINQGYTTMHGQPIIKTLKRLLDTWDRTNQQVAQLHNIYDDDDDDDDDDDVWLLETASHRSALFQEYCRPNYENRPLAIMSFTQTLFNWTLWLRQWLRPNMVC